MNVAIIPAKGTSRRIPGKNVRPFRGIPIIAYSIQAATKTQMFDRVIVSTEDPGVAAIAGLYGAEVLQRPAALCEIDAPDCGTQAVVSHVLNYLLDHGDDFENACCIYPCAPMLTPSDLIEAYDFLGSECPEYVFSVTTAPLADAGMFYWGRADTFLSGRPIYTPYSIMFPLPPERGIDINSPEDWARAEAMYDKLIGAAK